MLTNIITYLLKFAGYPNYYCFLNFIDYYFNYKVIINYVI